MIHSFLRGFMVVLVLTVAFVATSSHAIAKVISKIDVRGAERVEVATIKTYLPVTEGDTFTQDTLDRSLKSLYATGFFADVTVRESNGSLIVNVIENPIVNRIVFEGNDKIEDEELLQEIRMRPRMVLTRTKIQSDTSRLYQIYKRSGRFSAQIDPKLIKLDQNRVNLVFEITEGEVTEIKGIRFVGNRAFDDGELRSKLSSKENKWYRFLSSSDRYDPDRLAYDQELLRRFYLNEGYADFRILSAVAELSEDKESFFMTFTVDEGQRYRVSNAMIHSTIQGYRSEGLKDTLDVESGDWYSARLVESSSDALVNALEDEGYPFVRVSPDIKRNTQNNTVHVIFNVAETRPQFVERINIRGNVRTMDKVVRREFEMSEGDPLVKSQLAESEQNIRDLGYFENVEVKRKPGSAPDKQVLDVNVVEKSTGEISFGAGFSTNDGPLGDIRLRERNFLGKGQDFLAAATIAGERTEFDLSLTEPYFMDRDISATVDAFHITRDLQDESSYDQRRSGGGFGFGFPLSENLRENFGYRIEQNEITDVENTASRFIRDQEGERITSAITHGLDYTNLDSRLFPTDGVKAWFDTEYAGIGGDANYISSRVGSRYYYPLTKKITLSALGEVGGIWGIGGEGVQINERFYLGGATLRGFEDAGVGPRDTLTDDALGGNYFYRGSFEGSFPLGLPEELGIKGHAFTDFGSLWEPDDETGAGLADENSIRASGGVGLSWVSPLGLVRFDYAIPYASEDFDEEESFRFSFGTSF